MILSVKTGFELFMAEHSSEKETLRFGKDLIITNDF